MAQFVVIGALALDRPVRLSGPLRPGVRLQAQSLGGRLAGRLGGGGGNAGTALVRAGHTVRVATFLAEDDDGREIRARAEAAGLDLSAVIVRPGASGKTLILIDPNGERVVMGLDSRRPRDLPALPSPTGPIDGLYVRAPHPGAEGWARAATGPVLAHWPTNGYGGPAGLLVGSADDLSPAERAEPLAAARAAAGPQVAWAVVTRGADGVEAHGEAGVVVARPPKTRVLDATGAGDIFAAGLMDALAAGADMPAALDHACRWGATAVGLEGSAPVDAPKEAFPPFGG